MRMGETPGRRTASWAAVVVLGFVCMAAALITGCSRHDGEDGSTTLPTLAPAQLSTTVPTGPVTPQLERLNRRCAKLQAGWHQRLGSYRDEKLERARRDPQLWIADASWSTKQLQQAVEAQVSSPQLRDQLLGRTATALDSLEGASAARGATAQAAEGLEALRLLEVAMSNAGAPSCTL